MKIDFTYEKVMTKHQTRCHRPKQILTPSKYGCQWGTKLPNQNVQVLFLDTLEPRLTKNHDCLIVKRQNIMASSWTIMG
jgi:hypothetical protein